MNAAPTPSTTAPGIAFLVLGRILPLAFFAFLLVVQAELLAPDLAIARDRFPDFQPTMLAINRLLQLAFVGGIALVYLLRRPPAGTRHQALAVLIAFYASFILLAVRPLQDLLGLTSPPVSGTVLLASDVLVLAGLALSVYSLSYLRLNFSITAEARGLITGGPYRIVRHPIYLGEILTGLGIALGLATWFGALVWLSFVAAQLVRTRYEEDVLAQSFPEYQGYAGRTKRLLPWLV